MRVRVISEIVQIIDWFLFIVCSAGLIMSLITLVVGFVRGNPDYWYMAIMALIMAFGMWLGWSLISERKKKGKNEENSP